MVFLLPFWHTYLWQSLKKNARIIFEKNFPRNLEERKIEPFFRPNFAKGYLSSFREVPGIPMDRGSTDENLETYFVIFGQGQAIGSLIDRG